MSTNWEEYFYYDETSPTCLRWKIEIRSGRNGNKVNCRVNDVAGSVQSSNKLHSVVSLDGIQYLVHRVIYEMFNGPLTADDVVDHRDGNGWNNRIINLRKTTHEVNMRNCKQRVDNQTGVTGVHKYLSRHGTYYYSATWKRSDGKQGSKTFSTTKYGDERAFQLACEYREKMINERNQQGAGYTDDHGKR